ncbi:MAG TPA: preprotein translocase subunit SecE [Candidatus Competibacteraceae bacterium]|nr:preprotein translocase subunit SecE [Candidatus Competibacteraceae bacterium]
MNFKVDTQVSKTDTYKLIAAVSLFLLAVGAFYYFAHYSTLVRVVGLLAASGAAIAIASTTELGGTVLEFIKESRMELRKVVWPTRTETLQTTAAILVMVVVMALFLWLLDVLLIWLVRLLTGHG